ncbi:hypothetical protein [Nonomuraea salmonea]|uniref:hypothetical protein n=1 Tax=Nonomuraea salmonea TaxID=46181 RepID=UPI002FE94682
MASQGPLSSAFVEIVADTSKLEDDKLASQIKKSIGRAAQDAEKGLDGVADAAERVGKAVGEEIADGAKDAAKALGEVGAEGLGDVEDAAKRAGRAVGDELTGGARKAAKALGGTSALTGWTVSRSRRSGPGGRFRTGWCRRRGSPAGRWTGSRRGSLPAPGRCGRRRRRWRRRSRGRSRRRAARSRPRWRRRLCGLAG